jgi:hypothetical protein
MIFRVEKVFTGFGARCSPETPHEDEWDWRYIWTLMKGEEGICRCVGTFEDEKATRSNIAKARKSLPGVKFAKVETAAED